MSGDFRAYLVELALERLVVVLELAHPPFQAPLLFLHGIPAAAREAESGSTKCKLVPKDATARNQTDRGVTWK